MGYTTLRVAPSETAVRTVGSLRTGPTAAENEHLAIAIDNNGTLTVTDKASQQTYTDLLLFEDRSEIGDGWYHSHSANDEQVLSSAGRAQVAVVHEGPEIVTFRVDVTLDVPAHYDWHREARSAERVELKLSHFISLRRDAQTVDVETIVHNSVQDHRLRLLLPTDATAAETFFAHHPFDFVERSIKLDESTHDWQEDEVAEKPFLHAQAVGDGNRGLAFLSNSGLHEGGVMDDKRRTLQVTLLRSFRKTIATGGESDGLEQGEIRYQYALLPYSGELPRQQIVQEVNRLQTKVLLRQSGLRPSGFPPLTGTAAEDSLLRVEGDLLVSAIKPGEQGDELVIRFWNPSGNSARGSVHFKNAPKSARALKLNEAPDTTAASPVLDTQTMHIEAAPHRIVTIGVKI
jgi:alpha-mannosidase